MLDKRVNASAGFIRTRVITGGEKLSVSKVGGCIRGEMHEEVERRAIDRVLRKVGPPGFPRGHGAPVGYSEYNPRFHVPTCKGPKGKFS